MSTQACLANILHDKNLKLDEETLTLKQARADQKERNAHSLEEGSISSRFERSQTQQPDDKPDSKLFIYRKLDTGVQYSSFNLSGS